MDLAVIVCRLFDGKENVWASRGYSGFEPIVVGLLFTNGKASDKGLPESICGVVVDPDDVSSMFGWINKSEIKAARFVYPEISSEERLIQILLDIVKEVRLLVISYYYGIVSDIMLTTSVFRGGILIT